MGARGESIIQVGDREVHILYTMRALADAEREASKPVSMMLTEQGFGIQETAILLRAGMEAARRDAREGGPRITLSAAYDVLEEIGWPAAAEAIGLAVAEAMGSDNEGEQSPNP